MRLTAKVPDWKQDELDMCFPIGIKLCNHITDYMERKELLDKRDEFIESKMVCSYHTAMHWAKFKLTKAQVKWLLSLD